MSQGNVVPRKHQEKKKKSLGDFKKKQSFTGKSVKIVAVGSSAVAWRDYLRELVRPTYGDTVYEFIDEEYTEDWDDVQAEEFEPADPNNPTRVEEVQFEHVLRDRSKKQDRVDDHNRLSEEGRSKVKGVILATVDKELQKKCTARNADYERDLDLYNFVDS